jgi:hypothetical protein
MYRPIRIIVGFCFENHREKKERKKERKRRKERKKKKERRERKRKTKKEEMLSLPFFSFCFWESSFGFPLYVLQCCYLQWLLSSSAVLMCPKESLQNDFPSVGSVFIRLCGYC